MEDMVGKQVQCPACGKEFLARPETALSPATMPGPTKKTGVKNIELKPGRKDGAWAELEVASPSRQPAAKRGGLFFLWLGLAFLGGAAVGGTGVYVVLHNQANQDPFAELPDGFKGLKDFEKEFLTKKESEDQKKGEAEKKGEITKKGDDKIDDKKRGPAETAGGTFFKVKTSHIMAAGFSKDGKELLVCGRDGDLTWYDSQTLTPKRVLPMPDHKKGLDGIDMDREGKTLLAVSFGTLIELVDSGSGERNRVESKIRGNLRGSAISDDGKMGITLLDQLIWVWDLNERKLLKKLNPHQGLPVAVALSPDGKLLASSGQVDDSVTLIDTKTFKEVGVMERAGGKKSRGTNLSGNRLAFSPDGKYLALPSIDKTLIIFHVPSKKQRLALEVESKSTQMGSCSFSGDGNTVALGVGDGTVHLWDVRTGERRAILSMASKKPSNIIGSVRFSPDAKKVMAANRLEEQVFVWDLEKVKLEPVDLTKTVKDPDSATVAVAGEGGFTFLKENSLVMAAAFSKDAREILLCTQNGAIKWYDTASMTEKRALPKPEKYSGIGAAAIDPEGKTVLAISFESLVEAVDGASGDRAGLPTKLQYPLPFASISADGKKAAAFLSKVAVWDLANRKLLSEVNVGSIRAMALSASGKWLATGDMADDSYKIWDTATGKELAQLVPADGKKERGGVLPGRPAFSPDDKYLAATALGNQLVIYHLPSKKQRMALQIETKSTAMASAAFSNDGNTVAQAVMDGTIHLFDVRTGERRAVLSIGSNTDGHLMESVSFSQDDSKLLANDRLKSKVFVWDLNKVKLEPVDLAKTIKDPTVAFDPKDPKKKPPMGTKEVLKIAGPMEAYLGIVMDADAGSLLATMPNGTLKQISYPDFKVQGIYKLGGAAYRPVLDQKNGLLYALVPNPKAKPAPVAKKRGGNEIYVYDVKNVLDGKIASGNTLRPSKVFPLNTFAAQLLLAPDGASLHVLDNNDPKSIKLIRLDTAKGERGGELALAENTDCLCLSRDGKKVLAGSHVGTRSSTKPKPHQGSIQVIDTETMKLDKAIAVPIDPFFLEAGDEGLVFASGGSGLKTEIVVVDINEPEPVAIWKGVAPGSWLRLSDDRKRLFVSNWRSKPALVSGLILPDKIAGSELPSGNTVPVPLVGARGELMVTPDGQFMICEAGVIFRLKE
jgi:WD40 repeat protein